MCQGFCNTFSQDGTTIADATITYIEKVSWNYLGNDGVNITPENHLAINSQRITPTSLQAHASLG